MVCQLYQLRGRVGRSSRIGYAYFLHPANKVLNETAEERLQAIKEFTELGSGFKIAMRDLNIRGAAIYSVSNNMALLIRLVSIYTLKC